MFFHLNDEEKRCLTYKQVSQKKFFHFFKPVSRKSLALVQLKMPMAITIMSTIISKQK